MSLENQALVSAAQQLQLRVRINVVDIDPSIFSQDDKEVVEDLILMAIKDAQKEQANVRRKRWRN